MNTELAENTLGQEIEKVHEVLVWSDDPRELEDMVTALLEFDDELKDALYNLVIKSAGTKLLRFPATERLHSQVAKTITKYARFQLESDND